MPESQLAWSGTASFIRIHLGATPPDAAAPAYEPAHAVPEDAQAAGVEDGLGTYTEGRGL